MKLSNVDLNLLKVFVVVYQQKSLRKAGEKLFVSTPAVSQSIKKLKNSLDEELFVLSNKQFLPTPFSDSLYQRVFPLLEELSTAIETEKQFDPNQLQACIHLEINPHILSWFTPVFFQQLFNESPKSTLLSHTISQHSFLKLQQDEVDFVIHFDVENLPSEIIAVPLVTLTFVMALRKEHPFNLTQCNIDELLKYPFGHVDLAYFDQKRHSILEEELIRQGKSLNVALRTTSIVGLIETVKQTNVIAPCLMPVIKQYKQDLKAVNVSGVDEVNKVQVFAYLHKKNQYSAKYKWLLDLLETAITQSHHTEKPCFDNQ